MKAWKKYQSITSATLLFFLLATAQTAAVAPCAVCVIAIGSGLGISRALGIDDSLTGVWIGALLLAVALFTAAWGKNKWPKFRWWTSASVIGTYTLTIPFFFIFDLFSQGGEWNGMSRLLLGMIIGTIFLILGLYTDKSLRAIKSDHKGFFPFQKVVVPVVFLSLATGIMCFVCG